MRAHYIALILVSVILVGIGGCTKEKVLDPINETVDSTTVLNTTVSNTPVIELEMTAPTTVVQFDHSITFTISYTDGDGDIGFESADSIALHLTDMRDPNGLVEKFHIPPMAPDGAELPITGVYELVLPHTAILDDANTSETTTYKIKLKDRAGNWSNEVESVEVTVQK